MNDRTRSIFKVIAGGYLAYLGVTLCRDVLKARPDNYVLFLIAGVVFIGVGGYLAFINLKEMAIANKANHENEEELEEDSEQDVIEEDTKIEEKDDKSEE